MHVRAARKPLTIGRGWASQPLTAGEDGLVWSLASICDLRRWVALQPQDLCALTAFAPKSRSPSRIAVRPPRPSEGVNGADQNRGLGLRHAPILVKDRLV